MFSQFFENSINGIDMGLAWVLDINKDIIEINNDKYVELLGQNFIDVILEAGQYVGEPKDIIWYLK